MIDVATAVAQTGETGLSILFESYLVFVAMTVMGIAAIGLGSRSMAVSASVAYLAFAHLTIESAGTFLTNILYVSIVIIFVGFAFKFWRLEMGGGEAA